MASYFFLFFSMYVVQFHRTGGFGLTLDTFLLLHMREATGSSVVVETKINYSGTYFIYLI